MNHKKEVISHHSLPWLPQDCAKMHHTLGFPLHLSVSASVLGNKTASEPDSSSKVIYTVALLVGLVLYQPALSQTMHGHGFEDSPGQGWFPEAPPFFWGREFKFADLSDMTSYLSFTCFLQHKIVQSCMCLQRVKKHSVVSQVSH